MPRVNLDFGDSGDLPVTFAGDTIQQAATFKRTGVLTLSTTGCHVYIFDPAISSTIERAKIVDGAAPRLFPVTASQNYDVRVAGTSDAQPSGVIHYSFAAP
jgi:hypothetical protein